MDKIYNPNRTEWQSLCQRPEVDLDNLNKVVSEVFLSIKSSGDEALREYTEKFDGVRLQHFEVTEEEILTAENLLSTQLKAAINLAKKNIEVFHRAQIFESQKVETAPGVVCWQEARGIEKVGIYIPGGTAPLFSTILMLAIPATLAGCKEIILCTPPNKEGSVDPAILYTAKLTGVTRIFKIGGIQAIGGLTFGTESIPAVYKIFGPGNQYVTAAKQFATKHGIAIDMPAGPSELLVMADSIGNAEFIASDLLSQAEHGVDSQVLFVTTSQELMKNVEVALEAQLEKLPRKEIASEAILNSRMIYFETNDDCIEFINRYAPEHYILMVQDEAYYLEKVVNAGSVFIGKYTPESAGDYASGTNHTLPTNGYSRAYSGVNLDSFTKKITFQKITDEGIKNIGPSIELMAEAEGLQAHKNAVTLRLKSLES